MSWLTDGRTLRSIALRPEKGLLSFAPFRYALRKDGLLSGHTQTAGFGVFFILGPVISLVKRARDFANRIAVSSAGSSFTYGQLLEASASLAGRLLYGEADLNEKRVALVIDPGMNYVKTLWAVWRAGGIAVPLHPKAPVESHHYVLKDAGVSHLVMDAHYQSALGKMAGELGVKMLTPEEGTDADLTLPDVAPDRGAMILYTSGTTGSPKGV